MRHARVKTQDGYEVDFWEADLVDVGTAVEIEIEPGVFETQIVSEILYYFED